jgi:hypothetical protein
MDELCISIFFTQPNGRPHDWSHVLHVAIGTAGQSLPGQDLRGLEEGISKAIPGGFHGGSKDPLMDGSHRLQRTWIAGDTRD